jgi:hypothetical protein
MLSADFLPKFGPSYINLYGSADPRSPCKTLCRMTSRLLGLEYGEAYKGQLLLGIETETEDSQSWKTLSHRQDPNCRVVSQPAISIIEVSNRF